MKVTRDHILIFLIGCLLFIPFLGASPLFDWDEVNFAEASREMVLTGNYTQTQIDFRQFWEKPPLFFWMQAASMKVFGINEFAARFPNAVCGILTLLVLFSIGKKLRDKKFGWLWVLAYAGSILPQFYFKSGIIDPWFNLLIFLSLYYFIKYIGNSFYLRYLLFAGLLLGCAILTKGPVAGLIMGLCILIYFISNRFRFFLPVKHILFYLIFIALPIIPWISIEIINNGTWFITEFLRYQLRLATTEDASHGGFFGYHFVIVFIFCFPASIFALRSLFKRTDDDAFMLNFRRWMLILFWVVMILFSIVETKIVHYSSLAYFPLTFLTAYTLYNSKLQWRKWESVLILFIGFLITATLFFIPVLLNDPSKFIDPSSIKDKFTSMSLFADGEWSGLEGITAIFLFAGIIAALILNNRKKVYKATIVLFVSAMITINLVIILFTPHIALQTEGALIDFFKKNATANNYTDIIGYKSYMHLFYGQRTPQDVNNPVFIEWINTKHGEASIDPSTYRKLYSDWLLNGNIDKPVFFATNVRKEKNYNEMPQLMRLYEKNGYVFYKREKQ